MSLTIIVCGIVLATAQTADAKSTYLSAFNSTYGTSATALNTCILCHPTGAGGRNAYGTAYENANHSFSAIESVDSDGDGFTNVVEINARTFPGNASSKPASTPPPAPGDTTPPTVGSTSPINGAMAVSTAANVTATFSEAVKNVSTTTFTLKAGATSVPGTVTINGSTATFDPTQPLATGMTYTAMVTTGVTDLAGNALRSSYSWSFTTATAADTTRPTVSATSPMQGQAGIATNAMVTATFSEAVKNVTTSTFMLKAGTAAVSGTVTLNGMMATFKPSQTLANSTTYTATVTTGVTDLANNALASSYSWSFTTGAAADMTPPAVSATTPGNGSMVPASSDVTVTFSETVDPATLTTASFMVQAAGGAPVAGVVTAAGNAATFSPAGSLAEGVAYTATLTTAVEDLAGNPLPAPYAWTFTASAAAVDPAPAPSPSPTATDSVGGGGCSVMTTGGGPADLAGSLGALLLVGVALGARRALRRPGRPA